MDGARTESKHAKCRENAPAGAPWQDSEMLPLGIVCCP
jgi:hypothetical protein